MDAIKLFSPAKLNLFFRVLRKREDGYHEIASLYQAVSLGDTLSLQYAEENALTCNDSSLPCDESNLVWKAVRLFERKTGIVTQVHLDLTKKIPLQSGLGGGSSNAATALWGLNQLYGTRVSDTELRLWSSEIGSDVAFFFSLGSAYCTGRGEIVQDLPPLKETKVWIAKPQEGLSTLEVYRNWNSTYRQEGLYSNDLEGAAFYLNPSLAFFKKKLLSLGFERAVMTGSGSAFFCMGEIADPSLEGAEFFPADFVWRKQENWYIVNDY
jgi:4-diphosphocytidyl-2-C-methyl-D-erythritol kinase